MEGWSFSTYNASMFVTYHIYIGTCTKQALTLIPQIISNVSAIYIVMSCVSPESILAGEAQLNLPKMHENQNV